MHRLYFTIIAVAQRHIGRQDALRAELAAILLTDEHPEIRAAFDAHERLRQDDGGYTQTEGPLPDTVRLDVITTHIAAPKQQQNVREGARPHGPTPVVLEPIPGAIKSSAWEVLLMPVDPCPVEKLAGSAPNEMVTNIPLTIHQTNPLPY